ncbi:MAG TPA: hypothetical protein VFH51_03945, partial [Myxococcota bacterium]|nr:hypothetical protein [Myxococcota bacterium]
LGWATAAVLGFAMVIHSGLPAFASPSNDAAAQHLEMPLEEVLSRGQLGRVRDALAVYRATFGEYPDSLDRLVQTGLLQAPSLRFPWQQPYVYARSEQGFLLLRPLW